MPGAKRFMSMSRISSMEYLGYEHFAAVFAAAIIFHIVAYYGWSLMPRMRIIDIPVHAMNIRLGDNDVQQAQDDDETAPQPIAGNSAQLESEMTKLIRKPSSEKAVKKTPRADKITPPADRVSTQSPMAKTDTPRQFVRFNPAEKTDNNEGSALGNSTDSKADVKAIYEQTISLWIQKFKIYPDSRQEHGIEGSTVIRIRIDRHGNIRWSALEGNTGYAELDRAALDMVRRANPVPAAPDDYKPEQEMFEFLIPVTIEFK